MHVANEAAVREAGIDILLRVCVRGGCMRGRGVPATRYMDCMYAALHWQRLFCQECWIHAWRMYDSCLQQMLVRACQNDLCLRNVYILSNLNGFVSCVAQVHASCKTLSPFCGRLRGGALALFLRCVIGTRGDLRKPEDAFWLGFMGSEEVSRVSRGPRDASREV